MTIPKSPASPDFAKERSRCVLLLVDVINRFEFPGSEDLLRAAKPMAEAVAALRERAYVAGVPVVYANDNFGRWRSDFRALVRHCQSAGAPGREIAERLAPSKADYFILKPSNSAFFATALELMLRHFEADTLVITGVATDNCILFTAHDAYLRGFRICVPRDGVAAETPSRHRRALEIIERTMKADIRSSKKLTRVLRRDG